MKKLKTAGFVLAFFFLLSAPGAKAETCISCSGTDVSDPGITLMGFCDTVLRSAEGSSYHGIRQFGDITYDCAPPPPIEEIEEPETPVLCPSSPVTFSGTAEISVVSASGGSYNVAGKMQVASLDTSKCPLDTAGLFALTMQNSSGAERLISNGNFKVGANVYDIPGVSLDEVLSRLGKNLGDTTKATISVTFPGSRSYPIYNADFLLSAAAAGGPATPPYQFTSTPPKLQIPLPTLPGLTDFMPVEPTGEIGNRYLFIPWIGQYFAAIYKYVVGVVGILSGIMIMVAGLIWLTAGGSAERIDAAKKYLEGALIGLVISLTSFLVLYAINPALVSFENLKVKFVERVSLSIGYADPTPAQETSAMTNPAVATGNTLRDQLLSVCAPKNSGITQTKLLSILPTWVDIGKKGGASYIRGGLTQRGGCTSNPQQSFARTALEAQGISFDPNASPSSLGDIYQKEIVDKVFASGRLCGDCVSWTQQLFECAGMDYHIRLPRLKGGRTGTETGGGQTAQRIATSETSCGDAASKIPGGLKFGDFFHKSSPGHMVIYVGGAGLPYEIVEMGGAQSPSCELIPGLTKTISCVRTTDKKENWRKSWNEVTEFCDIFRITPL